MSMKELAANPLVNFLFMHIIVAAIILYVGVKCAKLLRNMMVSFMARKNVDAMLVSFFSNIAYIALMLFVIIAALGQLGVQTTSIIAMVGAAGLAIGLSLQNSLSNVASGMMIIFFRPFKVGDFIEAAGVSGTVEGIHIFSSQLRSADNKAITVPNASITAGNIVNYSAKSERRVDLVFGIGYDDDIRKAKRILQELLDQEKRILKDPEAVIAVSELADNSVNLVVRPWVRTDDYWDIYWALTEAVKLRFDEEGIKIPYPQRDVHLHQVAS
jgi:small conductance mechanosensitive channel